MNHAAQRCHVGEQLVSPQVILCTDTISVAFRRREMPQLRTWFRSYQRLNDVSFNQTPSQCFEQRSVDCQTSDGLAKSCLLGQNGPLIAIKWSLTRCLWSSAKWRLMHCLFTRSNLSGPRNRSRPIFRIEAFAVRTATEKERARVFIFEETISICSSRTNVTRLENVQSTFFLKSKGDEKWRRGTQQREEQERMIWHWWTLCSSLPAGSIRCNDEEFVVRRW